MCVICGRNSTVERHHVGGQNHLAWLTVPLCRAHHTQLHQLLTNADVNLEYTKHSTERLIRALAAMNIFMCMIVEALRKKTPR
jgi:hypothetical protein